ncbi:hypothetical protein JKF63_01409 [Porcisia hertigi]|uniref:Uncharacterized protein n=1 Tax=Porcisia hertigi TaxID=2761500 RepID=A0A836KZL5_9TRYP|nr:hypothetical protein JKF63_01409 [Porcisia hertigi]
MSLFTRRGRVEVSSGDSRLNSSASSVADSADELIEELARMTLAGHYSGKPSNYEISQLLQGRGIARRPREVPGTQPTVDSSRKTTSEPLTSSPSRPSYEKCAPSSTHGERRFSQSTGSDANESESDARALERMYRHLAREYLNDKSNLDSNTKSASRMKRDVNVAACGSASPSPLIGVAPKRKPRRKPDEAAQLRLLEPTRAQLARRVERFERRREREENARKHPKRLRVPAEAVKRGTRLFLLAQTRENHLKEVRERQETQKAVQKRKECTFRPSVSKYAARLAEAGGYYTLEERFKDRAAADEKQLRLRLQRAVELEKECTFQPTLSPGTEEFMSKWRRRRERGGRSRSFRSPEAGEGAKSSRRGRRSPLRHEPFEPGERLYRDGGEHLLRQQVRRQRAAAMDQRRVVGGGLRLSHTDAQKLADRFTAWATSCAANREELRIALERRVRGTPGAVAEQGAVIGRTGGFLRSVSSSSLNSSKSARRVAQLARTGSGSTVPPTAGASAPLLRSSSKIFPSSSAPRRASCDPDIAQTLRAPSNSARSSGPPPASGCAAATASVFHRHMSPSAPTTCPPSVDVLVCKDLLRVRLGALFYKYAVSPTSTAVCLAQVKEQVRRYYPEDSSIVAALASAFVDEQQPITKTDFMAALACYVAQYGIRPWCLPHGSGLNSIAGVGSCPAGAPAGASAATTPTNSVNFSSASEPMDGVASVSTPSWTDTGNSSITQSPREGVRCSAGIPIVERACDGRREPKPIRTHIYSLSLKHDHSPPTPAPAVVAQSNPVKANRRAAATTAICGTAAEKPRGPRYTSRGHAFSKYSLSQETSNTPVRLLHKVGDHVQRSRRAADRGCAASEAAQPHEECTFRPTLTARSVVLSDRDLERRMTAARELQQRRHKLHLLRSALLAEQSGEKRSPSIGQLQRQVKTSNTSASMQTPPLTQSQGDSTAPRSGAPLSSDLSPSIELSSVSSSTPRNYSGGTPLEPLATSWLPNHKCVLEEEGVGKVKLEMEQIVSDVVYKKLPTQTAQAAVKRTPRFPAAHAGVSDVVK